MSIVTLVSGGLDSTLMGILAKQEKVDQLPLFIDYGQRAAKREWVACRRVHRHHRLPQPKQMKLPGFGKLVPSGLTNRSLRIYEDAFLPGRNLLFLIAGASYAYVNNVSVVAIGLLSEKHHLFPDQTKTFIKMAEQMIAAALNRKVSVVAPLMGYTKIDILGLAAKKHITGTYSCHSGRAVPCGKCVSCLEIINAQAKKG